MATAAADTPTAQLKLPTSPHGGVAASIGRNTFFGAFSNLVQVATRLITIPVVIYHLGLGGYGIWNVIMMTATYMRFGSVGIKTAFQKYVAEATGNGDYDRAAQLLSTGCAIMVVLSLGLLIPAALLSRNIAVAAGVPPDFLASSAGAISLLAVIMMMSNVGAAFEAIIMGGHRIDLVRKFSSILMVLEAVAIITVLHFGYGILAMAAVMGASELIYITACYVASHRIVPQIQIGMRWVTRSVVYELFRFAGSYQLVNYLEVLYVSIVPIAVLRGFGADSAGVYAVVTRVVASVSALLMAFGPTIVSGGTLVYASGDAERMRRFLVKTFKVIFGLTFLPIGFAAVFGPKLVYAWTGATDPRFRMAFSLVCLSAVCGALSGISMVLYRVAGKAILDNMRQVLRIAVLLAIVLFARRLGFGGTLSGLCVAEFTGMVFMMFALKRTFHVFSIRSLLPEATRVVGATVLILAAGLLASYLPVPGNLTGRAFAALRLVEIGLACALVALPSLYGTGSVTASEGRTLFGAILPSRRRAVASAE